jgi:LuxR family glucitol operon transcriptional activator
MEILKKDLENWLQFMQNKSQEKLTEQDMEDWVKFIEKTAKLKIPSTTHYQTFVDIFGYFKPPQQAIETTEGHLTQIFKCFEEECPELKKARKNKQPILRKHLQILYAQRDFIGISDRPPQSIPTPDRTPEEPQFTRANLPKIDYYGLPNQPSKFIGRNESLQQLYVWLSFSYDYSIIIIDGIGGVGKTSLIVEAAYRCLEEKHGHRRKGLPVYDLTVFLSFKTESLLVHGISQELYFSTNLNDIFHALENALGDESILRVPLGNEQVKYVVDYLNKDSRKILLIIDDLQSINDSERKRVLEFVRILPKTVKIVITTRTEGLGEAPHIRLEQLSEEEGLNLINQQLKLCPYPITIPEDEKKNLYKCYSGLPLALVYSVGQIDNCYSVDSILGGMCPTFTDDIALFCFQKTIKSLKWNSSAILLNAVSLFKYPPSLEAIEKIADLKDYSDMDIEKGFAELKRCAFIYMDTDDRCNILSITKDHVNSHFRRNDCNGYSQATENRYSYYLAFAKKHGGTDWEYWWGHYKKVRDEWGNLSFEMKECIKNEEYKKAKDLWDHLNHFADLSGYWSERIFWLDWFIDQSKKREDWQTYVQSLSRKAWTLTLQGSESYKEAKTLSNEAWELRIHASLELQDYIAHNRITLLIRTGNYQLAKEILTEKNKVIDLLVQRDDEETRFLERRKINSLRDEAKLNFKQGYLEDAKKQYFEVKERTAKIQWQRMECYAKNELADICIQQGDLESAEKYLKSGERTAITNRNSRRYAYYQMSFSEIYSQRQDQKLARETAAKSAKMFKRLGMTQELQKLVCNYKLTDAEIKNAKLPNELT